MWKRKKEMSKVFEIQVNCSESYSMEFFGEGKCVAYRYLGRNMND